jgi:hypothetical protein
MTKAPEEETKADSDHTNAVNQQDDKTNMTPPTSTMMLRSAGHAQSQQFQEEGHSVTFQPTHFVSSMPFTSSSKIPKQKEMAESYLKEKDH